MKKKKESFVKENYKKSWRYIKDSKIFIYFSILIFGAFMLMGAFLPTPEIVQERIFEFIKEITSITEGMSQGELIGFIFLNNIQSGFMGMILGVFFGIFSAATAAINGYLVGFVSVGAVEVAGIFVLWKLVPHGVFELPALFISVGLGLKLGTFFLEKEKFKTLKNYLKESLRVFLFIIIPLLVIAAIIEGTLIFLTR